MACFVKLKDNCYILWSTAGDCPAEPKLFSQTQVREELQRQHNTLQSIGRTPALSPSDILTWIETYGTSDLGKGVNKDFVEKYNSLGPKDTALSIEEIIKLYS